MLAVSSDGLTSADHPGATVRMSNGIDLGTSSRYYAYTQDTEHNEIISYSSPATGTPTWTQDSGVRLADAGPSTYELGYVREAAVAKTGSCYVMAYVTRIPGGT